MNKSDGMELQGYATHRSQMSLFFSLSKCEPTFCNRVSSKYIIHMGTIRETEGDLTQPQESNVTMKKQILVVSHSAIYLNKLRLILNE